MNYSRTIFRMSGGRDLVQDLGIFSFILFYKYMFTSFNILKKKYFFIKKHE